MESTPSRNPRKKEQENGIKNDPKLAIPYILKPDKDTTKR